MEDNAFKPNAPKNLYLVTHNDGWLDPRALSRGKEMLMPDLSRFEEVPMLAKNVSLCSLLFCGIVKVLVLTKTQMNRTHSGQVVYHSL